MTSCVKVYGRCGRLSSEAWRTCCDETDEMEGTLARRSVVDGNEAIVLLCVVDDA